MANANGWGDGASNNNIGWGQGADNAIGWGDIHADSWAGLTDIVGITTPPVDPDAQAFITAASITDPTQQGAINTLVVDLKGYNIWTKFKAIYPIVGGSASSHAVNLKTPGTYNLSFATGWTHSSTGMTPNGTSAFANTLLIPNSVLSLNSTHLSYYSRTNTSVNSAEIGSADSSGNAPYLLLQTRTSTNRLVAHINDNGGSTTFSNTNGSGFYIGNRTASNVKTTFKNGIKVITDTYASSSINSNSIYLGAYHASGGSAYSDKQCAFASIGDGLTDTEAANFYTAVQAFQTSLNRQI